MSFVLGLGGAVLGALAGVVTHRLNQSFAGAEPDATEPPLAYEAYWAPVLDAGLLGFLLLRQGRLTVSTAIEAALILVLVQIFVFDARHRLILNRVIYPATAVALVIVPFNPLLGGSLLERLFSGGVGALLGGGTFLILVLASRGGVGLGEAKLTFFVGLAMGVVPPSFNIVRALIYGVVLGAVGAAFLLAVRRRGLRDYIPYGPYLCAGAILALLFPCGILAAKCL